MEKSIAGVLGILTRGRRMVGADKTMELWRPPKSTFILKIRKLIVIKLYWCTNYYSDTAIPIVLKIIRCCEKSEKNLV